MSYQPYTEDSMTEPNFARLDWRLQDEALQATGSNGDRYTIEYVAADPDVGIMDPYWFAWVQEPDGEIADSWHMDTLHEALSSCQRRANMRASRVEKINLETLIGTEYSPEIVGRYDWIDHYPVVSGGRIIAIYDAKNRDPEEYADYPIIDDAYIDADAEPEEY